MGISKYKVPLILISVILIFLVIMITMQSIIGVTDTSLFFNFIPGINGVQQTIVILALYFVVGTLGTIVGGYLFAPIFLTIHKKIFGKKRIYGIEERPEPEKFSDTSRSLMPALMTISISTILSPFLTNIFLSSTILSGGFDAISTILSIIIISLVLLGLVTGIFQGVWFILDTGIIYSNKNEVEGTRESVEIKTVGGYFKSFLEGYAGIGVFIAFFEIIYGVILLNLASGDMFNTVFSAVFLAIIPLILAIGSIPGLIIMDIKKEHRKNYMISIANKLEITDKVEATLVKKN